jgi:hypothetical protein
MNRAKGDMAIIALSPVRPILSPIALAKENKIHKICLKTVYLISIS